ncbi:MBL fold metallo-hydrolase [Saccharopolyspora rectivirgula]|uniref:Metallo-beta-lactamase domain-containing protein n=1 Tax=Saccharopolyspora rectivirgula TaxID=28042 RepID=A0A073AYC5_9PSEU|nr:MBL fold metallo-hydrolase [Saccharopolyspora rectivirgula]KEI44763.1 hypothetical protein GU90_08250 [Saccharopolyspora rectivirgula]
MLVLGFPVGPLQANCYVLARGEGEPCVVIDPGQDAFPALAERLQQHRLTPEAVLLTHGHFDHVFSAGQVCLEHGVPAWIHPADRFMLADPAAALGPMGRQLFGDGLAIEQPKEVHDLADGMALELAGLQLDVSHTPGHTAGSVVFAARTEEGGKLLFSGDTLFAGGIGRTDLPGGDHRQILRSLSSKILPMDDDVVVLPGHGPSTSIGRERSGNPFLQDLPEPDTTA